MISQNEFRQHFPHTEKRVYFNHAAVSPLSNPVLEGISKYLSWRNTADPMMWTNTVEILENLRANYAKLVGSSSKRIALAGNTATGINYLASGLDWKPGDRVLLNDLEFPANVVPYMELKKKGVHIDWVKSVDGQVRISDINASLTTKTRVVAISSVQYSTGFLADLEEIVTIAHANRSLVVVDAIQSIGVIPIDVEKLGVDFLAAGGHKWQMSPLGTGFFYLTEALQNRLNPDFLNYLGKEVPSDYANYTQKFSDDARKFEIGVFNGIGLVGAKVATDLLIEAGVENIYKHVLRLQKYLLDGLPDLPFHAVHQFEDANKSGIFMFSHDDTSRNESIQAKLNDDGFIMSYRGGALRFAPHYYNSIEEVDRLIGALRQY
jgi:cysteine desulfurase / selenocysteine lyase